MEKFLWKSSGAWHSALAIFLLTPFMVRDFIHVNPCKPYMRSQWMQVKPVSFISLHCLEWICMENIDILSNYIGKCRNNLNVEKFYISNCLNFKKIKFTIFVVII